MAKPSKPHSLSKKFLMGVALSVVPLAGCTQLGLDFGVDAQSPVETSVAVSAEEAAAFERARSLGTVPAAEQFLRTYPNSELVRSLLRRLPRTTLRGIDDELVEKISPAVINSLPFSVRQALGVSVENESNGDSGASDGYSG